MCHQVFWITKKNISVGGFFLCFAFLYQSFSFAWGFEAHKEINRRAILGLPSPLIKFYKSYRFFVIDHSVDPDKRKHFQKGEAPKHYINTDLCESYPFINFPKQYKAALAKYGKDSLQKIGILPWNIERICQQLTQAFAEKNGDRILKLSADLGHYIGDAAVPLHVTKNYNGQLTQQEGLHALWETQSVHLLKIDTLHFQLKEVKYIPNINKEIWNMIIESYSYINEILRSEEYVTKLLGEGNKYHLKVKKNRVKKNITTEFATEFLKYNTKRIQQRIQDASNLLASLYYTSWVNAHKPSLDAVIPHSVPKSESITTEEEEEHVHTQQ